MLDPQHLQPDHLDRHHLDRHHLDRHHLDRHRLRPQALSGLGLLAAGIPLTLLVDLACPAGPDSRAIYAEEAGRSVCSVAG